MPRGIVRFTLTCAAVAFLSGQVVAAPQISVPACDGLQPWAASVDVADTYEVAPVLKLPKALQDGALLPVFGVSALSWSKEDIQTASKTLTACAVEAKKKRDKPTLDAFSAANYAVVKLLTATIAYAEKAKTDAATLQAAIDGLPDSAELDRGLQVLTEADPAAPAAGAYQGLPREVVDPLWRFAAVARTLPHADREAIYADFAKRRGAIQASLSGDVQTAIAAALASADGALELMQIRQDLAKMAETDTRRDLEAGIEARLQEVQTSLRAANPPTWTPPDCPELYHWSGGPDAQTQIQLGAQRSLAIFQDDRVMPLFGVSLGDWSDDDLARFKTLRSLCRARWQGLPGATKVNNPPPDAPELLQLASKGRWIEDADSWITSARTATASYRKAREAVDGNLERLAALPETPDSLAEIEALSSSPALSGVSQDEQRAFQLAAGAKVRAIRTAALTEAAKSLESVKVELTEDLGKLASAAGQALSKLPDYESQNTFRNEFQTLLGLAATHVMQDFQGRLEDIPASRDGLLQSGSAVSDFSGIRGGEDVPALGVLRNAAVARSQAIIDEMREQNCAALWNELGMSDDDVVEPVWGAGMPTTMGELVCGMTEGGVEISEFKGAGFFSKDAALKLTLPLGGLQTIALHKAEVAANQSMLVGRTMADANQEKVITVQEWELLIGMTQGRQIATKQICDPVMGVPEENLTASQRMLSVDCAVEILNGTMQ